MASAYDSQIASEAVPEPDWNPCVRAVEPLDTVHLPGVVNVPMVVAPLPGAVVVPLVGGLRGCGVFEAAYAVDTVDPALHVSSDPRSRTDSPTGITRTARAATPATMICFVVVIVVSLVGRLGI